MCDCHNNYSNMTRCDKYYSHSHNIIQHIRRVVLYIIWNDNFYLYNYYISFWLYLFQPTDNILFSSVLSDLFWYKSYLSILSQYYDSRLKVLSQERNLVLELT